LCHACPDDDLITAEKLVRDNKIRRLPVCDLNGKLAGIISLSDLTHEAGREQRDGKRRAVRSGDLAEVLSAVPKLVRMRPRTSRSAPTGGSRISTEATNQAWPGQPLSQVRTIKR
jgi:CBS-domain-containing membrane protein